MTLDRLWPIPELPAQRERAHVLAWATLTQMAGTATLDLGPDEHDPATLFVDTGHGELAWPIHRDSIELFPHVPRTHLGRPCPPLDRNHDAIVEMIARYTQRLDRALMPQLPLQRRVARTVRQLVVDRVERLEDRRDLLVAGLYERRARRRVGLWVPVLHLMGGDQLLDSASGRIQPEPGELVTEVFPDPDERSTMRICTSELPDPAEAWVVPAFDWIRTA